MYFLFLCALSGILILFLLDSIKAGITPNPTSKRVKEKVLEMLPIEVKGEIYELGSGFGKMAIALSHAYPQKKVKSFEMAKIPYWIQRLFLVFFNSKNMELSKKNFKNQNLSSAGLIFCYLYKGIMPILSEKFIKELRPGTWIISHTFALPNWKPVQTIYVKDLYNTPVYLYQV